MQVKNSVMNESMKEWKEFLAIKVAFKKSQREKPHRNRTLGIIKAFKRIIKKAFNAQITTKS